MNITIRLTKVEYEMLKILRLKDLGYRHGLPRKIQEDLKIDFAKLKI